MSKVIITNCPSYSQEIVDQKIKETFNLLGGIEKFVKPSARVLLKVNALMAKSPDEAVTTHPSILRAVIKEVKKAGGIPIVGDSPGNYGFPAMKVFEQAGFVQVAKDEGVEIVPFQIEGVRKVPNPIKKYINDFYISSFPLDVDVIINLPKLKTHNFLQMTSAIKNMFGVIPGFYKTEFHIKAPAPSQFAELLIELFALVKPTLSIVDAVVGMEGEGPSAGIPRQIGAILAGEDAVALDAIGAAIMGFKPKEVLTTNLAEQKGLGISDLDKVEIIGDDYKQFIQKDFKIVDNAFTMLNKMPKWMFRLMAPIAKLIRVEPVIDQKKCINCKICARNCPAKTIFDYKGKQRIEKKNCIMCFCCHELCQYKAIEIKRSLLAKLMRI